MIAASPLSWPTGKLRARNCHRSRFDVSFDTARDFLLHEIRLFGGKLPVLSSNVSLRFDGLHYATDRQPDGRGVAIYFTLMCQQMCFCCDRWNTFADNIQAVRKTIEALRGIERWGTGDMVEEAFTGFLALPAPPTSWEVVGLKPGASREEIKAAFRA